MNALLDNINEINNCLAHVPNTCNIAKPEHETAARNTVVHAVNRVAIVYNPLAYYRLMY